MESYEKKLSEMSKTQFNAEMKKYFNGSAPKSEVKHAKDCIHYGNLVSIVDMYRMDIIGRY